MGGKGGLAELLRGAYVISPAMATFPWGDIPPASMNKLRECIVASLGSLGA